MRHEYWYQLGKLEYSQKRESAVGLIRIMEGHDSACSYLAGWVRGTNEQIQEINRKLKERLG